MKNIIYIGTVALGLLASSNVFAEGMIEMDLNGTATKYAYLGECTALNLQTNEITRKDITLYGYSSDVGPQRFLQFEVMYKAMNPRLGGVNCFHFDTVKLPKM